PMPIPATNGSLLGAARPPQPPHSLGRPWPASRTTESAAPAGSGGPHSNGTRSLADNRRTSASCNRNRARTTRRRPSRISSTPHSSVRLSDPRRRARYSQKSWHQPLDVVQHVTDEETPPDEKCKNQRQILARGRVFGRGGGHPCQCIDGEDAPGEGGAGVFDLEDSVSSPHLQVLERRPNVDSVLRIQKSAADRGDDEQDHDRCGVGRAVDTAELVDERAVAPRRRPFDDAHRLMRDGSEQK